MTNSIKAKLLLRTLYKQGVRDLCICAGARNAPLIQVAHSTKAFELFHFNDERSAAFFALGRIISTGRPVAVSTTSGTAAAELLPAVIEAHYAGHPLIVVTADRPPKYRGSGAPQVIEQVGLFSGYVDKCVDCVDGNECSNILLPIQTPLHINICFDEPLLADGDCDPWLGGDLPKEGPSPSAKVIDITTSIEKEAGAEGGNLLAFAGDEARIIEKFIRCSRSPIVLVSTLQAAEREAVSQFLQECPYPIYCEGTSGLREALDENNFVLRAPPEILDQLAVKQLIDGVIRIGGVPNHRFWRNLEMQWAHLPVLSLSRLGFRGLSRGDVVEISDPTVWLRAHKIWTLFRPANLLESSQTIVEMDRTLEEQMHQRLQQFPHSELSLLHLTIRQMAPKSQIFVGNSLPIREWDMVAPRDRPRPIFASRGANGIDGQLSTFLGLAQRDVENWCFLGDLTTLYDLSAPWALREIPWAKIRIVVINNGGGRIFQRLFADERYQNCHSLKFADWAHMWGLHYESWRGPEDIHSQLPDQCVIELFPNFTETERSWQ